MPMHMSDQGMDFLMSREGSRPDLYSDDGGANCTIGVGHLVHHGACVYPRMPATPEEVAAEGREQPFEQGIDDATVRKLLTGDVAFAERVIFQLIDVRLTQNQFDALVSFIFNVGVRGFALTNIPTSINQGDPQAAADEMMLYVRSGPARLVVPGLLRRRSLEVDLFLHGRYADITVHH